jgi:hypothetical protein
MVVKIATTAAFLLLVMQTSFGQPASKIYGAQYDDLHKRIYASNLDGSGLTSMSMLVRPHYLAVDWTSTPHKLYVGLVPSSGNGKIVRCNTDGSDVEDVVTDVVGVGDIELDLVNRKIYWLQDTYDDDRIWSANMDSLNSGITQIYATTVTFRVLWGLALDVQNQVLWITERGTTCYASYIKRMSFSGSGVTIVRNPLCNPHDIEYFDGYIFWGDLDGIHRANPDGTGVDTLVSTASIVGLAIDGTNRRIYWSDYSTDDIRRVDLDGSDEMQVISMVGQFAGIDTDYNPSAVPVEQSVRLPETIELLQNYPNPFNPSCTIEYRLPTRQLVKLSVYDLYGRQVAVLVDGVEESGYHRVQFSGGDLSSGVYFYRLHAGSSVSSRKLVLLR